jgi:hypothetical protein
VIEITVTEVKNLTTKGELVAYRLSDNANGEKQKPDPMGKPLNFNAMGMITGTQDDQFCRFTNLLLERLVEKPFTF